MESHEELMTHLQESVLQAPKVIAAFKAVDRADFVGENPRPYIDLPLRIGHGQTISQPTTVAIMLELLDARPGNKVLDVGSGSAWTTVLLAHIVGENGFVHGVERIPELVNVGRINLMKYLYRNAKIRPAKGLGLPEEAPFDRILVSAAADDLPSGLVQQLAQPGRMVIPIASSVWLVEKNPEGLLTRTEYPGFGFVPLK